MATKYLNKNWGMKKNYVAEIEKIEAKGADKVHRRDKKSIKTR